MVKQVQEISERRIAVLAQTLTHVFGDVQRHRAVRPQQAEEAHPEFRRLVVPGLERRQCRGGEVQFRHLPEAQRFLSRQLRMAGARRFGPQGVDTAQQREVVVCPGLGFDR